MTAVDELLAAFGGYLSSRHDERFAAFAADFDADMRPRRLAPRGLPVTGYLAAADGSPDSPEAALVDTLAGAADELHFGQTYGSGDFGVDFLARYGWVELFGTRGHFVSDVLAGGFLLLGPGILYPDHHHIAEEIYVPLTPGSLWSRDGGGFEARKAGEIIHHPSGIRHAMQTTDRPLVALYLWRGGLLVQKPDISGRQP